MSSHNEVSKLVCVWPGSGSGSGKAAANILLIFYSQHCRMQEPINTVNYLECNQQFEKNIDPILMAEQFMEI